MHRVDQNNALLESNCRGLAEEDGGVRLTPRRADPQADLASKFSVKADCRFSEGLNTSACLNVIRYGSVVTRKLLNGKPSGLGCASAALKAGAGRRILSS